MKQLYTLLIAFLFVYANTNAQTVTTVDPAGNWSGYMTWFDNDNGAKGGYQNGSAWGMADVKTTITATGDASYANGAVTLQPNFSTYADGDAYWSDGSGGGNKWMEGVSKIELAAGALGDTSLSFVGTVAANTLDNAYSAVAFIKTLNPNDGYATVIFETAVLGAAGSTFAVSASGIDAAHVVQYGFLVEGINANPANEVALGNVVVTPFTSGLEEEEPDYTTLTADASEAWKGYVSWFANDSGVKGSYIDGAPWENINLVKTTITAAGDASYPNGAITLQPNFNLYAENEGGDAAAQAYWTDGAGKGNKFLEGNSFVEYAAGEFTDGALKFVGNIEINDIYAEEYTVIAFIKTINATSFATVIDKTVELGANGTSFEVKASGINSADIVQYGFSVRGLNANPTGETFLGGVIVTPDSTVLSVDKFKNLDVVVYPNPVNNTLNISAGSTIDAVNIFDLTGREVLRATPNVDKTSLDVSSLNKGFYLLTVKSGNQELTTKLVK